MEIDYFCIVVNAHILIFFTTLSLSLPTYEWFGVDQTIVKSLVNNSEDHISKNIRRIAACIGADFRLFFSACKSEI